MLQAIKVLILSLALVAIPMGVTAKHETFDFMLPHEVANQLEVFNLHLAGAPSGYEHPGCDTVVTFPLRGHNAEGKELFAGYAIHAIDVSGVNRLVSIELFALGHKQKVFAWTNMDDYLELKKCHTTKERLSV